MIWPPGVVSLKTVLFSNPANIFKRGCHPGELEKLSWLFNSKRLSHLLKTSMMALTTPVPNSATCSTIGVAASITGWTVSSTVCITSSTTLSSSSSVSVSSSTVSSGSSSIASVDRKDSCQSYSKTFRGNKIKKTLFRKCDLGLVWFGLVVQGAGSEIQWWNIPFFRDTVR